MKRSRATKPHRSVGGRSLKAGGTLPPRALRVGRRTRASGDTSERLLDSAEQLFAEHGFDGIGMRELAAAARVNLGAATYYFGSKKALYIAVFMRRFQPSNAEQLSRLHQAQAEVGDNALPVARIVDCVVRPIYALGIAHPSFSALLTRNVMAPPEFMHAALLREFGPTLQAYAEALHRALPRIPVRQLRGRLMFAMGSLLTFSAQMGRLVALDQLPPPEQIFNDLARFISAGLQAPADVAEPDAAGVSAGATGTPPRCSPRRWRSAATHSLRATSGR